MDSKWRMTTTIKVTFVYHVYPRICFITLHDTVPSSSQSMTIKTVYRSKKRGSAIVADVKLREIIWSLQICKEIALQRSYAFLYSLSNTHTLQVRGKADMNIITASTENVNGRLTFTTVAVSSSTAISKVYRHEWLWHTKGKE
jgi:hypothetical protein